MPGAIFTFASEAKKREHLNSYLHSLSREVNGAGDIFAPLEDTYVPLDLLDNGQPIDPHKAITSYRNLVLLGEVGAGKTTLLKHLVLSLCRESLEEEEPHRVPVFFPLLGLARSGKGPRSYLNVHFKRHGFIRPRRGVEHLLRKGHCLLVLDGLDELPLNIRGEAVRKVLLFHRKYPRCRLLVSCRRAGYRNDFPGFTVLDMGEWDRGGAMEFMEKRFSQAAKHCGLPCFQPVDTLLPGRLFKNPLILSVLAALCSETPEQLPRRVEVYKGLTKHLLGEWDANKGVENYYGVEEKSMFLGKLALRCQEKNSGAISEPEMLNMVAHMETEQGIKARGCISLLDEVLERSGLLVRTSPGSPGYRFLDRTIRDYFTALELSRRDHGFEDMISHLAEPGWEESIVLYAGFNRNGESMIRKLREDIPEDIFYGNLMLSARCIGEARLEDPLVKEETIRDLWNLYRESDFPLIRNKSLNVLCRIKPHRMLGVLCNQLTDQESQVRCRAAETLGAMGDMDLLPSLLMVLSCDKDKGVRCKAALAVGRLGGEEAVRLLIRTMVGDTESAVRKNAAAALGSTGEHRLLPSLIRAFTSDPSPEVRGGAVEALVEAGGKEVLPFLLQGFSAERNSSVRWRIATALGKLNVPEARKVLLETLKADRDAAVRESAAEALGKIGGTQVCRALSEAMAVDKNPDVRGAAAYALGVMRCAEALQDLIRTLMNDSDIEVRGRAAYALGQLGRTEAIPYLAVVFNSHKESLIRGNATFALGTIAGVEALPFLVQALMFDKDNYVRYRAAEILGSVGNHLSIQPLRSALKDEGSYYGWRVKDMAFEALEKISRRLHVRILR